MNRISVFVMLASLLSVSIWAVWFLLSLQSVYAVFVDPHHFSSVFDLIAESNANITSSISSLAVGIFAAMAPVWLLLCQLKLKRSGAREGRERGLNGFQVQAQLIDSFALTLPVMMFVVIQTTATALNFLAMVPYALTLFSGALLSYLAVLIYTMFSLICLWMRAAGKGALSTFPVVIVCSLCLGCLPLGREDVLESTRGHHIEGSVFYLLLLLVSAKVVVSICFSVGRRIKLIVAG